MTETRELRKTRAPGIYQTADGRFVAKWTHQVQGRRAFREEVLPAGATLEDAITLRARRLSETKRGSKKAEPPSLADFAVSWLERNLPRMKPSAAESYAGILEDHVVPFFHGLRVDEIRRSDVERWVAWCEMQRRPKTRGPDPELVPYARDTLLGWWSKLKQLLRDAAAEHDLPDPTNRVKGPKAYGRQRVHEERTLTADELIALFHAVPAAWHLEVFTDAVTGMRPGELYALRWEDVDTERGVITVRRSHTHGRVGTTKTGKRKDPAMPPELAALLKERREAMIREQHPALATGLVFPATEEGKTGWHRRASAMHHMLVRHAANAGIVVRVTPQVLRRTFNTHLVDAGVARETIRAIMGHSSQAMTDRYTGATLEMKRAAVINLAARLRA